MGKQIPPGQRPSGSGASGIAHNLAYFGGEATVVLAKAASRDTRLNEDPTRELTKCIYIPQLPERGKWKVKSGGKGGSKDHKSRGLRNRGRIKELALHMRKMPGASETAANKSNTAGQCRLCKLAASAISESFEKR